MPFDDFSMVDRFKQAVECLVGLGTIQERLDRALFVLLPLRFEDFPLEVAEEFRPIHEGLSSGAKAEDLIDERAVKVAGIIVGISHRLRALYEETKAARSLAQTGGEPPPPQDADEVEEEPLESEPQLGQPKFRVYLSTRDIGKHSWTNEIRTFASIPAVGEYISIDDGPAWHEVKLVLHTPFEPEYDAEVHTVPVDHVEARKKKMGDYPSD